MFYIICSLCADENGKVCFACRAKGACAIDNVWQLMMFQDQCTIYISCTFFFVVVVVFVGFVVIISIVRSFIRLELFL